MSFDRDLLVMLLSCRHLGTVSETEGVLLSPVVSLELPINATWSLWALSGNRPRVSCRLSTSDTIDSFASSQGEAATLLREQQRKRGLLPELHRAAMNQVELDVEPAIIGLDCPLFLSPFHDWKPRRIEAILRMKAANVSVLPDFHSYLGWRREFDREDPFLSAATLGFYSSRLFDAARSCETSALKWIPFGTDCPNGDCGVIEVIEDLGDHKVRAILHLPNDHAVIQSGAVLARYATWTEAGMEQRSKAEIADVINLAN